VIRIFIILIVSAISYFGIVFLIETKAPNVQSATATPVEQKEEEAPKKENPHGLPDGVIGSFVMNQDDSSKWLANEATLNDDDRAGFRETQKLQAIFNFDGNYLWRESEDTKVSIATLEVKPEYVKLLATVSLRGTEHPTEFFLQTDEKGFWLTQYLPVHDGSRKIYRARYERITE
jgi:hypothetical protein